MKLKPINIDLSNIPNEFHSILTGAKCFDSSCSPEAKVMFIDKGEGYFLKSALKGTLEQEAVMTRYFHSKGLSAEVLSYLTDEKDWLLTTKVLGEDCTAAYYLEQPKRLVDILAENLYLLHQTDFADCPVQNHTERYLHSVKANYELGKYDHNYNLFNDRRCQSAAEAFQLIEAEGDLLRTDTLLHGDYCLPNIILNKWKFRGFIDIDCAGVGDRHVDLFWALWTLVFNLKTEQYSERFMDAYGRKLINEDTLKLVAAIECFG